jgi:asparagine synthase (glutamine-hydrolysing)
MCGIAGIFAYRDPAPPVDQGELSRIRDAMINRGPDGAGSWISPDQRVGLANRRLAILDLSEAGAQPMATPDGRLRVTFNGEIYNYRELRKDLERKGYAFRSDADTEVLLYLYADRGTEMVHALRGMYAFAIWDDAEQRLFLGRDPFGIKPLYYADDGSSLRFASQVKALLAGGSVKAAPESAGAVGFFLWGCVPEPFTLYRDIRALPAGSYVTLQRGAAPRMTTYFSVRAELAGAQTAARPFLDPEREALGQALRDSVKHHLLSDVPLGVFLSAGVDSALVTALASEEQGTTLRTFTLGFEEYRGSGRDEVPLAELSAASCGTRHETRWIQRADFGRERDAILQAMDQPTTDGVNMYFVCREAARAGLKVALSGLGGDELFGGYPSFRTVPRLARWLRPARYVPLIGWLARILSRPLVAPFASPKLAGVLEYGGDFPRAYLLRRALFMPWELRKELDPVAVRTGLERLQTVELLAGAIRGVRGGHAKVVALELAWYMRNQLLRDADWAGMAHSLEVRVPLVDVALFRALAPWLVSSKPPAKADAAHAPRVPLAREITQRPKSGFSVPVREWLITDQPARPAVDRGLRSWAREVLPRQPSQFRALVLVTDAFGGHGGIAKFNRDLLAALSAMPECAESVAIPRLVPAPIEPLPPRLRYLARPPGVGKLRYAFRGLRQAVHGPFDLIVAAHINFTVLAAILAWLTRARRVLVIHGIDAWTPHRGVLVRWLIPSFDLVIGVSNVTLQRFTRWSKVPVDRLRLLPNCVDLRKYGAGPKPAALARNLGLEGRTVIMTLGRLASGERYKGFDEVIEALPALAKEVPDIVYLVCGDGPDRARLESKAAQLGVRQRVVFAGLVPEEEKAQYYRLADAYVMPSQGEGFGIAFLEALACGLPVLGSKVDGGREALLDGAMGVLVNPADRQEVKAGILQVLGRTRQVPRELQRFSFDAFSDRVHAIATEAWSDGRVALQPHFPPPADSRVQKH